MPSSNTWIEVIALSLVAAAIWAIVVYFVASWLHRRRDQGLGEVPGDKSQWTAPAVAGVVVILLAAVAYIGLRAAMPKQPVAEASRYDTPTSPNATKEVAEPPRAEPRQTTDEAAGKSSPASLEKGELVGGPSQQEGPNNRTLILIHLHPDLEAGLLAAIQRWNAAQSELYFEGIPSSGPSADRLLSADSLTFDEAYELADGLRAHAGYGQNTEVFAFTEARIHGPGFYQAYAGLSDIPGAPNAYVVSLEFLRRHYGPRTGCSEWLLRATLRNVVAMLANREGLYFHRETRGCLKDFVGTMTDIEVGLQGSPHFCPSCLQYLRERGAQYLIDIANVTDERETGSDLKGY